jgi:hypothetical protein
MLLRHRARTVLIICPASLQEKWRVEMLEKFGLDFRVVDTAYIKQLRRERGIHANPWTIPSTAHRVDGLGQEWRGAARHARRPAATRRPSAQVRSPGRRRSAQHRPRRRRALRAGEPADTLHPRDQPALPASPVPDRDPHNGYTESFTSLLELLDDQRFARNILPDEKQLSQVMIRRLKSDLVDADGKPLYAQRKLQALAVPYTAEERDSTRS